MLVTFPLASLGDLYFNNWHIKFLTSVEQLPNSYTLIASIVFMMICEDFTFHFTHKFLHWKVIYPYIHKIHHTHVTTIGIAAEYAHPLEYLFGNIVPGVMGALILGGNCHLFTVLSWGLVRLGETLDSHSGYEFSWSPYRLIPLSTSAKYHDFHHSHNIGNFSSFFSFWDTIEGTN